MGSDPSSARERDERSGPSLLEGRNEIAEGEPRARLAAVGDIGLTAASVATMRERGIQKPFRLVEPLLRRADLRFGNLEYPLTDTTSRHPLVRHRTRSGPPEIAAALAEAGFDLLGLANNHILDCMAEGLADTVAVLRKHGIGAVGAGSCLALARAPALREVNGVRLAFLAYTFPLHQIATDRTPGCAPVDPAMMREDVRKAREHVDHVIVSLHVRPDAGTEFFFYPSIGRQRMCRSLIDDGASAVLCHHIHVAQGVEVYRAGVIAHGLGSFIAPIDDSYMRSARPPYDAYVPRGMVLLIEFDAGRLLSFEVEPTIIQDDLSVRPAAGEEGGAYLRHMAAISSPLYRPEELVRLSPDRSWGAKMGRAVGKAKAVGPWALFREVLGDTWNRVDCRLFLPRRIRAFREEMRSSPLHIEPNPPLPEVKSGGTRHPEAM